MLEAETPIIWPPDMKNGVIGKVPDAGKDWRQEEKGTIEDEMVGWHHQLEGHEFEPAAGAGDGQGSLVCCSPQGHRERLNWTELPIYTHRWGLWEAVKKPSSGKRPKVEIKRWESAYIWYLAIGLDENTEAASIQRHRKGRGLGPGSLRGQGDEKQ